MGSQLTPRQESFIRNLPTGCQFYFEDSLRGWSRTVRVDVPFNRSSYVLHVEYEKDPDGAIFTQKMAAVRELYGVVAAVKAEQEADEFICPF